jgi:PAS domain S-box-containing protein
MLEFLKSLFRKRAGPSTGDGSTQRKQAEKNAHRLLEEESARRVAEQYVQVIEGQREQLKVTLTSIGDAVITTDAEGRVTLLNPVAETLTGWSNEDAVGQPLRTVFHIVNERSRQPVENPVAKVLATGRIVGLANHTVLIARDATGRGIDDSGAPIRDSKGNVTGVVLVFRDVTEQRKAERSARFLASIVESSDDAIIGKDVHGRITSWNRGAERIFGYSAVEAIGRPIAMLAPADRADEMPAILDRIKRGERVEHFDTVRCAKGGRLVPISLSVSPIEDEDGAIIGASKIARDITERKRAEETLREEKARLHATLTGIGDAVIVTDAESRVTLMNPVAQSLTGWKEGAAGRPLEEVFRILNEQTHQPVESPVSRVLREGTVVGLANHTVLIAKDGAERPIDDSAAPINDAKGRVVGVVLVFRDRTEGRRAAEALQESEKRLAAELEAMTRLHSLSTRLLAADNLNTALDDVLENAIITSGADFGNIQLYNPQIGALEIVAQRGFRRDFLDYFRTVRVDEGSACAQAMGSGQRIIIEDVELDPIYEPHRLVAAAAGYRAVQSTPLKNRNGSILGMLSTHFRLPQRVSDRNQRLLDLYARHAADLIERIRVEHALKEADRRKDEFLAMLAHELRNPLAPIRNGLHIMKQAGADGAVVNRVREMMERQVQHMTRMVDDLLDVSRITRGKIELRKEIVDLATVVDHMLETTRPLIEDRGQQLTVDLPSESLRLEADPTRLEQVLANLLNNAAKFTDNGGHIWLCARQEGSELVLRVRDTGVGIAADMLSHIFEPFVQSDQVLNHPQGGLGIGLALVRSIVAMHGGTVTAHCDGPGKGTEFIVRLPAISQQQESQGNRGASKGNEQPEAVLQRRILVVDDNVDAAESLALLLRLKAHDVRVAHDGPAALASVAADPPELVFLDIGMPVMNGYDLAQRLRQRPGLESLVLVALTGWGQEEDRRRSQEAGFDHHLVKPVEPDAVHQLLARVAGPALHRQ